VVVRDGLVELPVQVVREGQREVSLAALRVYGHAFLEVPDRALVVLQLAVAVAQVGQQRLHDGAAGLASQVQRLQVRIPGLHILALLVLDDRNLVEDQGVVRADVLGLREGEGC
jgi:hypothetical protein